MNWRHTYLLTIVILSLFWAAVVKDIFIFGVFGVTSNLFLLTATVVHFLYVRKLNKAISNEGSFTKPIRNLEYVTYVATGLYVIWALLILYRILTFKDTGNWYDMAPSIYTYIYLLGYAALVYLAINTFRIRKEKLGQYIQVVETVPVVYDDLNHLKHASYQTEQQRLALCKLCANRRLDMEVGMVCGLHGSKPQFNTYCDSFQIDKSQRAAAMPKGVVKQPGFFGSWKSALLMSLLGFLRAGLKGMDDPMGIIFLLLGLSWLLLVFMRSDN